MLDTERDRPQHNTMALVCVVLCFLCTLFFVFTPSPAFAQPTIANGPTIQNISVGFRDHYQDGNWVPVLVTLHNNGPDFNGNVSINAPATNNGTSSSSSTYQVAVSLPSGSQKQVTLTIPLTAATSTVTSLTVNLIDNNGQKVASAQPHPLNDIAADDPYIGILSDQPNSFNALNGVASLLPTSATMYTDPLDATMIPTSADELKNFDMLVLDNFTTSTLTSDQFAALQNWVNQGGLLVVVGGPEWQRTLKPLPANLLPVTITGTATLPAGTHLLPTGGPAKSGPGLISSQPADTVPGPVIVSVAQADAGSAVLLSSGNIPLIAQAPLGQGLVSYIAFDPTLAPLAGWSNTSSLWEGLVLRASGDQILASSANGGNVSSPVPSQNSVMQQLLQMFIPNSSSEIWLTLILLLGYVLVLGPIRFLIVRKLKRRDWSWRIVLITIVLFTAFSYGLALQQKGTAIVSTGISVIQLNRPTASGSTADITTYVGVFVPNQGDFHLSVPGNMLIQPADQGQTSVNGQQTTEQTTITTTNGMTDVDLQGVNTWTLRSIEATTEQHTAGGITSHLVLQNNTVTGTVTNTLPYALDDAYVLLDNDYVSIGNLPADQSRPVNLKLTNSLNPTYNQQTSLANQIAADHNVVIDQYNPYGGSSLPQDELHRHMEILTTLDSNANCPYSSTCPTNVTGSSGVLVTGKFSSSITTNQSANQDSLLLPGAAATVIGWADPVSSASSKITVNGSSINTQEALVKAPLDVNFAGTVTVPPNLVTGQIVDVEQGQSQSANNGMGIQEPYANVYTLTTGSMTFELTLPTMPKLKKSKMVIGNDATVTNRGSILSATGSGIFNDINHMRAFLYNWQTGNWDSVQFTQYSLAVNNAQPYIGPGGRILLQVANNDSNLGTIIFSKPTVQLSATVTS